MEVGLVGLLRAAWIAGTLPILIASVPSSRLRGFRDAMLGFAKRGKIMQSSSQVSDSLFLVGPVWMQRNCREKRRKEMKILSLPSLLFGFG
jgi:hypothetical protein